MNKSFIRSVGLALIIALALSAALVGCVEKPEEALDGEWSEKEEFEPSTGIGKDTVALAERYAEYEENAGLAFKYNSVSSESDFVVSDYEDGVRIDGYIGDDDIIIIPDSIGGKSVLAIGEKAFSSATIRALYVPDSVCYIEKSALEGVDSVATLRLPFIGDGNEIGNLGHIFGSNGYSDHAVKVPVTLDMVIIGEKTTKVEDNAFAGCKSLSAVVLPDSVESVGAFAFYECRDLVYINASAVKSVGEYAFAYCSALYSVSFAGADSIGLGALYESNALYSLTIPFVGESESENRYIGYVFGAESSDHNAQFVPASLYSVTVEGCTEIPDRAFASCQYIGEFDLGEGISKIGVRAFYSCRSLIEIAMPESLNTISDDAFFGCDNLMVVDLGGVGEIGMQAFYGCRALTSVAIPDGVTEIKPSTFALCSSLESVELNNVKKIGKDAFYKCESLEAVDCSGIEIAEGNEALVLVTTEE